MSNGKPTLQTRVANLHQQSMVAAEFRMRIIRSEQIDDDPGARRFYPLKLEFDRLIMFPAPLTMRHVIGETSPLQGVPPAQIEASGTRFMTSIACIATVVQAPIQSQTGCLWSDVRFGHRLVEIHTEPDDDRLEVDCDRLHETEPLPFAS